MVIDIRTYDPLIFRIPAPKGGTTVEVTIPLPDCISPQTMDKINAELKAIRDAEDYADLPEWKDPNKNATELNRFMLRFFNPRKPQRDAIDALSARQINDIALAMDAEVDALGGATLGESESSTD